MKKLIFIFVVSALLFSSNLFAQRNTDIEGGKDHPLISRFQGSIMEFYQHINFGEYSLIYEFDNDNIIKKMNIEGKITRIQYSNPKTLGSLEIMRNYEVALKSSVFEIMCSFSNRDGPSRIFIFEKIYYKGFGAINALPGGSIKPEGSPNYRYLIAKGQKAGKDIYIVLFVTEGSWTLTTMDIIEVEKMETGQVTVKTLSDGIAKYGHITLTGVYFDTGKSTIKTESDVALKNIAEYLKKNPNEKCYIVGHTDNVGDFGSNKILSENRANAVMNELITNYGVDKNQLKAYGVASLLPVTSNNTDEGKARNRRVEIVEQ